MKQSTFTKTIEETGEFGTFKGEIKVESAPIYTVESVPKWDLTIFTNGNVFYQKKAIYSQDKVLECVGKVLPQLKARLRQMAHEGPEKTFEQKLNDIFENA